MKRLNLSAFILLLTIGFSISCSSDKANSDAAPGRIVRLDSVVADFGGMTPSMRDSVMRLYGQPLSDWLTIMGIDDDDLAAAVDSMAASAAFAWFYPDINKRFDRSTQVATEQKLGELSLRLKDNFPATAQYRFYGVVSPFNQSIMTVDSAMFIALNHYLGEDYEAYSNMENYVRRVKTPEHLPYDVAEAALALAYPYQPDEDSAVLNRLIYEGALINAVLKSIDGNEAEMNGWTDEQYELLKANELVAWRTLIAYEYLYSADPLVADRLIGPAPSTPLLSPDAPGRAGRFIGYALVKSYIENHPDVSDEFLLSPDFYNDPAVLNKSQYSPK